jgi:hypothetical protein
VDRDQHLGHALVCQVDHHTIRNDCKRKVISQVHHGSAARFPSPICGEDLPRSGRLMSFFEAMMLVFLCQLATAMVAQMAVWGSYRLSQTKLHAKPLRFTLSVEFNK